VIVDSAPGGVPWLRRPERLLDLWVLLVTALVCWPLLSTPGYPFARDLVFTPQLPLRPETLGLGTASPRAVPLDAVVGSLSVVVDGAFVGRVAVVGVLVVAGCGAHRAVLGLGLVPRFTVAAFAIWNPFVLERLGLGQWALLAGYAALFPLLSALTAPTRSARVRCSAAAPWLLLGALTPTGALLVGVSTVVVGVRRRADAGLVAMAVAVQLPWVVPALLASSGTVSDPDAVPAFASRAERAGGAVWSLIGLGGIWDSQSVPSTREGWLGHLTSVVVVCALGVAARRTPRLSVLAPRVWVLGVGSLLLSVVTTIGPAGAVVSALTGSVPGMGLLRDSQKWLAPFVVLSVVAVGVLTQTCRRVVQERANALAPTVAGVALLFPFLLIPDGAVVVHRVLTPVTYPAEVASISQVLADEDPSTQGALASVPWRLYRLYPWAGPYATYDPASRLFDVRVITADDLTVGARRIQGEDPWAARVGQVVSEPGPGTVDSLAREGVRWLLVQRDDAESSDLLQTVRRSPRAAVVVDGDSLTLVRLDDTDVTAAQAQEPSRTAVVAVLLIDLVVLFSMVAVAMAKRATWWGRRSVTLW